MKKTTDLTQARPISELNEKLGLGFSDLDLLKQAFVHRSATNEVKSGKRRTHNERVEFLGDAVLELIISEYLFRTYPDRTEGELTSFRAATVRTETLAETGRELKLGEYLTMSKGEAITGGRDKDYLLANTFEALLGALYLDQGLQACEKFLRKHLIPKIDHIVRFRLDIDAKTKFQEIVQAKYHTTPTYRLVRAVGPDHDRVFTMEVLVNKRSFGVGEGRTKQKAQEAAANAALSKFAQARTA